MRPNISGAMNSQQSAVYSYVLSPTRDPEAA